MANGCRVLGVFFTLIVFISPNYASEDDRQSALDARENLRRSNFLENLNREYRTIRSAVGPSIVDIQVIPDIPNGSAGSGTGWVYSQDGYIVTAAHVVEKEFPRRILCAFAGENFYTEAKLIGADSDFDIAVLKIDREDLLPVEIGDESELEPGDQIFAFGSPLGLNFSMVAGSLSAKNRQSPLGVRVLQIDASINPGHSGGPLVNVNGEVVGMNLAIPTSTGQSSGIGFALSVSMITPIVEQLIQYREVRPAFLGINYPGTEIGNKSFKRFLKINASGVGVTAVAVDSPAFHQGLRAKDIIFGINDFEITHPKDLKNVLRLYSPLTQIRVHVLRNGEEIELEIELGIPPEADDLIAMNP